MVVGSARARDLWRFSFTLSCFSSMCEHIDSWPRILPRLYEDVEPRVHDVRVVLFY